MYSFIVFECFIILAFVYLYLHTNILALELASTEALAKAASDLESKVKARQLKSPKGEEEQGFGANSCCFECSREMQLSSSLGGRQRRMSNPSFKCNQVASRR